MAEVRITSAARAHLLEIWSYTETTWGEAQADEYLKEIDAAFSQLADNPLLGKVRPEVRNDYCSLPVKSHMVFYSVTDSKQFVNIIGVLHSRIDVAGYI